MNEELQSSAIATTDATTAEGVPQPKRPDWLGTLPAPIDLTEEEQCAFEQMNDPLREAVLKMRDIVRNEQVSLIESRYKLGQLVLEIKDHPEVYGAMSDIQTAAFFGELGKTVYQVARRLAETYTPEEIKMITEQKNPETGHQIRYEHLNTLLRVEDKTVIGEGIAVCLAGSLSTRELAKWVNAQLQQKHEVKTTRQPRPKTFSGILENIKAVVGQISVQFEEKWGEDGSLITETFKRTPQEKLTKDTIQAIDEVLVNLKEHAKAIKAIADELSAARKRAQYVVKTPRPPASYYHSRPSTMEVDVLEEPEELDEDPEVVEEQEDLVEYTEA
jgi:hypothetical protein